MLLESMVVYMPAAHAHVLAEESCIDAGMMALTLPVHYDLAIFFDCSCTLWSFYFSFLVPSLFHIPHYTATCRCLCVCGLFHASGARSPYLSCIPANFELLLFVALFACPPSPPCVPWCSSVGACLFCLSAQLF